MHELIQVLPPHHSCVTLHCTLIIVCCAPFNSFYLISYHIHFKISNSIIYMNIWFTQCVWIRGNANCKRLETRTAPMKRSVVHSTFLTLYSIIAFPTTQNKTIQVQIEIPALNINSLYKLSTSAFFETQHSFTQASLFLLTAIKFDQQWRAVLSFIYL